MKNDPGAIIERPCLYLVATPIGNLGDITYRAIATLQNVDLICAEDTRTSQRLLDHYSIANMLESLHDKNEESKIASLIDRIISGPAAVALISDAGTPMVSDPGFRLTRAAHAAGIAVRAIPGPSAVLTALIVSGLPTDRFSFEGFLPARHAARSHRLQALADELSTQVFFEAPHRIKETLDDMANVFGFDRDAFVGRELTKQFETHYRGTLRDIISALSSDPNGTRGEFVIAVAGSPQGRMDSTLTVRLLKELSGRVSRRDAVDIVVAATELPRNVIYDLALKTMQTESPGNTDS